MSAGFRRWMLAALIAAPFVLRLCVAWQDVESTLKRAHTVPDDTFYELAIARNIARGVGITFDGVTPTTGFQPLFTAMMAPVEALANGNLSLPLHLALTFNIVCTAIALYVLWRIAMRMMSVRAAIGVVLLFAWSDGVFENATNGLETALAICAELWMILAYLRARESPTPLRMWLLGAAAFIAVLSRIDAVAVACGIVAIAVVSRSTAWKRVVLMAGLGSAAAVASISVFAHAVDGGWLLSSGEAVTVLGREYLALHFPNVPQWLTVARKASGRVLQDQPIVQAALVLMPLRAAKIVLGVLLLAIAAVLVRVRTWNAASRQYLVIAFVASAALATLYIFFVPGYWFLFRYLFPVAVFSFPIYGLAYDRWHATAPRAANGIAIAGLALFCLFEAGRFSESLTAQYPRMDEQRYRTTPLSELTITHLYDAAYWLRANVPDTVRVATWQGGTVGYFSGRTVINLDGVVNRPAQRAWSHRALGEYLRKMRCTYLYDEYSFCEEARRYLGDSTRFVLLGVALQDSSQRERFALYRIEYP